MISFTLDSKRLVSRGLLLFAIIAFGFVALDAIINYGRLTELSQFRRMFNIAREDSIPSWFSSVIAFLIGLVASIHFFISRKSSSKKSVTRGWGLIALFFFYMSADDAAEIHERFGSAFKAYVKRGGESDGVGRWLLDTFPSYPWQFVVGPLFAVFGVFLLWFLWREFGRSRAFYLLIFGLAGFATAVLFDFVEGIEGGHLFIERFFSLDNYTVRHFAKSIEECIEMISASAILFSFVAHLSGRQIELSIE